MVGFTAASYKNSIRKVVQFPKDVARRKYDFKVIAVSNSNLKIQWRICMK